MDVVYELKRVCGWRESTRASVRGMSARVAAAAGSGLTAAQVVTAEAARRGPLLNGGTARVRAEAYARQIDAALDSARSLLHP